jgi:hypothetical protein
MPFAISLWNSLVNRAPPKSSGLNLGSVVTDGQVSKRHFIIPHLHRAEHIVILGKTGTGKTSLIQSMLANDIRDGRGFLCIDLHGDLTPFILSRIAERERQTGKDLSSRTVILNPADASVSAGINVLQIRGAVSPLVSEVVAIFRKRWQLDHLGARTEELLRNSLWVLAESGLTLTELAPFLTDLGFRAGLIEKSANAEVKAYFRDRYEQLSDAMQAVVREAILNKVSAFTTDPAIRHIVGQKRSLDLASVLDSGLWMVLCLRKSELGENSETLAALILASFLNAVFARKNRTLFTLYADEVQNLASSGDTFEHLFAEARKFAVSVVTANQHLGQYSAQVRATLLSAGTSIFFRSSPEDAPYIARALDGGQSIERIVKELPNRHFIIRSGAKTWCEVVAPEVTKSPAFTSDIEARSKSHWARSRLSIEQEIAGRRKTTSRKEALEEWN